MTVREKNRLVATVEKISLGAVRLNAPGTRPRVSVQPISGRSTLSREGCEDNEIERQRMRTETYPNKETQIAEFLITYRGAVYPWQSRGTYERHVVCKQV